MIDTMYKCLDCDHVFSEDDANERHGLSDHKTNGAKLEKTTWLECPECDSDQLEEV